MRLQLGGARDARRVATATVLALSLALHPVLAAEPSSGTKSSKKSSKKSASSEQKASTKPSRAKKKKEKEPRAEVIYLEEEEEPEAPLGTPAPEPKERRSGAAPDASERTAHRVAEGSAKDHGGGPIVRGSLETTAYSDTDAVSVLSPIVAVSAADDVAGWSLGGSYLIDVVSAASVDIVSTASPAWTEVRHVGAVNGSVKWDPVTIGAVGVVSREPDYLALTGGGTLSVDLLEKNVTPYVALVLEKDNVGRTGLPHEYWKDKRVTSVQLGVTLVLSRTTIGSVQWDGSFERGYLAKPYRYVPLFAPGRGQSVPVGASIAEVNRSRLGLRPIEQLPSSRDRHAFSAHLAHRFDASTLRLDERLYADDWKLLASTTEVRYIIDLGRRFEIWPHLRYNVQTGVEFWKRAYEALPTAAGLVAPTIRTGDRELGPLQTIILGGGIRWTFIETTGSRWTLDLEGDVGRTTFSDALYITERKMGYTSLALEAEL